MNRLAPTNRSFRGNRAHRGFTLVELLAVVLIISLMATFLLFAMFGVQRDAQLARTRAQIGKLKEIVFNIYDSYTYRPLPVKIPAGTSPQNAAIIRLNCVRELMRLELPDRISDVTSNPTAQAAPIYYQGNPVASNPGLSALPSRSSGYLRMVKGGWTAANQGAECLYLIVRQTEDGGGRAIEFFADNEIGDTDVDGMPEILDGFGRPIDFLRWAPSYFSDLQPDPSKVTFDSADPDNVADASGTLRPHDTFDYMRTDLAAFRLFPLIFSGGPDRVTDIRTDISGGGFNYVTNATTPPNPYGTGFGTQEVTGLWKDNLDSHSLDVR